MLLRAALEKGGTFRFGGGQGCDGANTRITADFTPLTIVERFP
jgi:hypothetical protein